MSACPNALLDARNTDATAPLNDCSTTQHHMLSQPRAAAALCPSPLQNRLEAALTAAAEHMVEWYVPDDLLGSCTSESRAGVVHSSK